LRGLSGRWASSRLPSDLIDQAVVAGLEVRQRLLSGLPAGKQRQINDLLRELLRSVESNK